MCTFSYDLQSNEYGSSRKKAPIALFLKPNNEDNPQEKYRFRLLNFYSESKNDRRYPFISRYVHNHWGTTDSGSKVVDDCVTCPASPFIDAKNDVSLGYVDTYRELKLKEKKPTWDNVCPICRHVAEAWNAWNGSGKTDRLALSRIMAMKRQFQGVIPVYVINDPVNEKNNGRFKCIILSNQDEYKRFIETVNRERAKISANGGSYQWCNGTNAVDFYLRVDKVPVIYNEGKPNEKQGVAKRITKMAFGSKAYDLCDTNGNPVITKEAIDKFEFDDQYYVKSTKGDIETFYKKHYSNVPKNVPDEEEDVFSGNQTTSGTKNQPVKIPVNETAMKPDSQANVERVVSKVNLTDDIGMPFDDGDDGIPDDKETHNAPITAAPDVNDLLNQLDF